MGGDRPDLGLSGRVDIHIGYGREMIILAPLKSLSSDYSPCLHRPISQLPALILQATNWNCGRPTCPMIQSSYKACLFNKIALIGSRILV
jgi:hypothetical protein